MELRNLEYLRIRVDRRQEHANGETRWTDERVWLAFEAGDFTGRFLLIGAEWRELFGHRGGTYSDGYHKLDAFSECWTFYDWPCPQADSGIAPVRFCRVTFPYKVCEQIRADVLDAFGRFDASEPSRFDHKDEIVLDYTDRLAEWSYAYGRGKGRVELVAESDIRDKLGACSGEPTFDRSWNAIQAIARNTTRAADETATVKVWWDPAGFTWRAGGLFGGLINHGTDESPDWSVHT